jgi:hypothetical protein
MTCDLLSSNTITRHGPLNEWWGRVDLADWPNLSLIERAYQFQDSAIEVIDA